MKTTISDALGFVGGGQMATALAKGAVRGGIVDASRLVFAEPNRSQQEQLLTAFPRCHIAEDAKAVFERSDRVVLATKPQVLANLLPQLRNYVLPRHLVVSIAAGISLPTLSEMLESHRIIRVMPNTPAQIGMGASGFAKGDGVHPDDLLWVEKLLNCIGIGVEVSDEQLHAVTGLSGSGPAFVLMFIDAMIEGGVAAGLPRDVAYQLALQTIQGSVQMVRETGKHPAVLKDQVTSPAGTTIAGLRVLERDGMRSSVIEAILAATQRSRELGSH